MSYKLEVIGISKDGHTGHIEATFRVHDDTDAANGFGAMEKFGIGALEITDRYQGDVEKWIRESVAPVMLERHKARTAVHTNLSSLKGKKIDIG